MYHLLVKERITSFSRRWKENQESLPLLAALARAILGQPIGTPDAERRCSDAGFIVTKLRNRTSHPKLKHLWNIHANHNQKWAVEYPDLHALLN
jgi:hypothetical protein